MRKTEVILVLFRPSFGQKSAQLCFDIELCVATKPEDKQIAPPIDQLQPDPEIEQVGKQEHIQVLACVNLFTRSFLLLVSSSSTANPSQQAKRVKLT